MKFRLKHSSYVDRKGREFKKGDVIETNIDLIAAFGKTSFEAVHEGSTKPAKGTDFRGKETQPAPADKEVEVEGAKDEGDEDLDDKVSSKLGDDVTSEFETAKENGLLVFKNGKSFFVTEKEDPETASNEDEDLKSVKAVKAFIAKQIGGE